MPPTDFKFGPAVSRRVQVDGPKTGPGCILWAAMYPQLDARLKSREPVLLDGALGTELVRRGVRWRKH